MGGLKRLLQVKNKLIEFLIYYKPNYTDNNYPDYKTMTIGKKYKLNHYLQFLEW